jgi:hypothetical protein
MSFRDWHELSGLAWAMATGIGYGELAWAKADWHGLWGSVVDLPTPFVRLAIFTGTKQGSIAL